MNFRLRILRQATIELREIHAWIYERSPDGADRWLAAFETAAARVVLDPLAFPKAPEGEFCTFDVRQFLFKTRRGRKYRVLFTVVDDEIRILHLRGSGQDVMDDPGPVEDVDDSVTEE